MWTPRLAEAAHEHVVAGLQVQDLELHAALSQLAAHARELGQQPTLARVDAERDARHLLARALPELDEARDQRHGQVVDAVEAEVFEPADGGALAGPGEPRHHDHPQAPAHDRVCPPAASRSIRRVNSSALCRPRRRRRWLRAAVSISIAMLRPGRTGMRTSGSSTSSSG